MAQTVVEIHVPLQPTPGLDQGEYQYPWIDIIGEFLGEQGEDDDGEEYGEAYVFFVINGSAPDLIRLASRVATLPGVPAGSWAMVTDDQAEEFGQGRRVELPVP